MWKETTLGEICEFVRGPFGGSLKKIYLLKRVTQSMSNNML